MTAGSAAAFDVQRFQQDLAAAARAALAEVAARAPHDPIRAFALYTDSGAMTVCPAMAPASYFARIAEEEPDDVDYYRFTPAEWPYEAEGAQVEFRALCSQLRAHLKQLSPDGFAPFKASLLDTCEQCVQALRNEHFPDVGEDFLWLVTISDDTESASVRVPRVQRLNAPPVAQAFAAWAATWDDE